MVLYKCPLEQLDSFLVGLNRQREASQRCDFEMRSGSTVRLPCHRLIVENRTKLLRPSDEGSYHECASSVSAAALGALLQFVYTFQVDITISTVHDLLRLSREFALDQLRDVCTQFLDESLVTDQNWLNLVSLSSEFHLPSLQRRVSLYLAHNFAIHRSESGFLALDVDLMKLVLSSDCLAARDERDVLDVVRRWIGHDEERRMPFACDLLRCVRLPMLRGMKQDYRQLIADAVFSSVECQSLLTAALDYVTSPSLRWSLQSSMTRPRRCQGVQEMLLAVIPGSESIIHHLDRRKRLWCAISNRTTPVSKLIGANARSVSTLLNDKTLFMVDSSQGTMNFCLDIARNCWNTCSVRVTRRLECACVLADDCIVVIGGKSSDGRLQCIVESIDIDSHMVSKMADLPMAVLHPCVFFIHRKIIAIGGCTGKVDVNHVQVYDLKANTWTLCENVFPEWTYAMSAACLDGVVYLLSISGKLYTFDVGSLEVCLFKDFGSECAFGSSICVYRDSIAVISPNQDKTLLLRPGSPDIVTEASTELPCVLAKGQRVHLFTCTMQYQSPIHQTSGAVKDDVVVLLQKQFEQEASFQVMASGGFTLLHYACFRGDVGVVIALSKTEDMSARTTAACTCLETVIRQGSSPLHVACLQGNVSMALVLLDLGASVLAADSTNSTALYLSCDRGHESVVRLLLEEGAQVDARNKLEYTPLMIACMRGFADIAELLLNSGAGVNAGGCGGLTPLMLAAWKGSESVVNVLLGRGADVRATTVTEKHIATKRCAPGSSSLHIATCVAGCAKVVKRLLLAGADVQLKNAEGKTPLDLADPQSDVLRLLSQHVPCKPATRF